MYARVRSILGEGAGWLAGEPDAATTRMPAGWEPEPRGGRGPLAERPTFKVSLGPGGGSGAGLRESRSAGTGSGGVSEGGRLRTHFLGSK